MKSVILAFALSVSPASATTVSELTGNGFKVEDIECSVDAAVAKTSNSHCIREVPRLIFENICVDPVNQSHLKAKYRVCIFKGMKA